MTLNEAYLFLDLPDNPDKKLLAARYREKYNFFKMLHTNAPNAIIRSLQEKNLQTLEEIKKLVPGLANADYSTNGAGKPPEVHPNGQPVTPKTEDKTKTDHGKPLAYLIVHTENKDIQSFPLFEGDNCVGRNEVPGKNSITLPEDTCVSRYHCVITINGAGDQSSVISDDGRHNNGRPSLNGAYYNGNPDRIKTQKLANGDTVQIGMTKMVFKWNTAPKKNMEQEVEQSDFVKTIVVNI